MARPPSHASIEPSTRKSTSELPGRDRARPGTILPPDGMGQLRPVYALQRHRPRGAEGELAPRLHDLTYEGRRQDLTAARHIGQAGGDHDVASEQVAVVAHDH